MIDASGVPHASASVAAPSVRTCAEGIGAVLQPPVSAGQTSVFFRDGDTKIRFLARGGQTGDVTTVPGGATKVSFFSVSPDEKRIAVLVEDLSPATTINILLYVEDLHGRGHHAEIYTASTPKTGGSTLWPMGWHRGNLVLAVMAPCTEIAGSGQTLPADLGPTEWHVSSATTGTRLVTIGGKGCIASYWPSPAGVACVDRAKHVATLYDWTGKVTRVVPTGNQDVQSSLSPSGQSILFSNQAGIGALPSELLKHEVSEGSRMMNPASGAQVAGMLDIACLWIDESHVIGPQSVFGFPTGSRTPLPGLLIPSGVCAGRFPGGL